MITIRRYILWSALNYRILLRDAERVKLINCTVYNNILCGLCTRSVEYKSMGDLKVNVLLAFRVSKDSNVYSMYKLETRTDICMQKKARLRYIDGIKQKSFQFGI